MSTRWWFLAPALVVLFALPAHGVRAVEEENPFEATTAEAAASPAPANDPFGDESAKVASSSAPSEAPAGNPSLSAESRIEAERRIELELDSSTTLDFDEMPLEQIVAYLAEVHKIRVQIDKRALEEMGVDRDTLVTCHLNRIRLRSALNLILRPLDLTYTISDDVLLITSKDADEGNHLLTRVYDVSDLVVFQDEKHVRWDDYDSLIDAIQNTVSPDSWAEMGGGLGQIREAPLGQARGLVVTHTYSMHRKIAQLLSDLRRLNQENSIPSDPPVRSQPTIGGAGQTGPFMSGGMLGPGRGARPNPTPGGGATVPGQPTPELAL